MSRSARRPSDGIASRILAACLREHCFIAAAESLTGGLLADAFVRVPGASAVFLGSAVTYDIRAKQSILGVDAELLRTRGAVDPEVARHMASSTARLYGNDDTVDRVIGLSTTGVAGPGPDGDKAAGLVYIALAFPDASALRHGGERKDGVYVRELHLEGSREDVRESTVLEVLSTLSKLLDA
ncbi:nicotinamide-nucleotide amidohydrolase family protein [Bifidobacterium psychraerophilum]|jgi:nicotinamide-nucleotide amidase|uniref:CinA family protein n=1 Tax=Bifidobacterium psychraerophilum TaxID=218140 RepID=UPI00310E9199